MTTPIIGLIALLVIAIIGWAIAEAKSKAIEFTHSKDMKRCVKHTNTMVARNCL